jgi:hypothetical protein
MLETSGNILIESSAFSMRDFTNSMNLAYRVDLSGLLCRRCVWIKLKRSTAPGLCLLDGRLLSLLCGDARIGVFGSLEGALLLELGLAAASHDVVREWGYRYGGIRGLVEANWRGA